MDKRFDPQQAQEVIKEAVRLQQEHEEGVSQQVLEQSAAELGIEPERLREAVRRVEQERERRARIRRNALIALGVAALLMVLNLLYSHFALSGAWAEVQMRKAQVENVIQRRQALIPRLESLVQQASAAQREQLQQVLNALQQSGSNTQTASQQLERLLTDPAFRDDRLTLALMYEIAGAENRIVVERKRYAEAAARYNRIASRFPVLLARPLLGYPARAPEL
ncbi:MAG: LemA family protein [Armatimonadota bacterium]